MLFNKIFLFLLALVFVLGYVHSDGVDLVVNSISLLPTNNLIYNNNISINLDYNNIGTEVVEEIDFNVVFYYVKNSVEYVFDTVPGNHLNVGAVQAVSTGWDVNDSGDINICAMVDHPLDVNLNNDRICSETYYRDVNVNSLVVENGLNVIYGEEIDINIGIGNLGIDASNNFEVELYIIEDVNSANIHYELLQNADLYNVDGSSITYVTTTWTSDFIGLADFNIVIVPLDSDYNSTNNYRFFNNDVNVKYVDLNTSISVEDTNVGQTGDINCTFFNNGNYIASYDVEIYYNGILLNFDVSHQLNPDENETYSTTWTPESTGDYTILCYPHMNDVDYNLLDNNASVITTVYSDTNVDLKIYDITLNSTVAGTTSTATCDINNIGDENATLDYNVIFSVNDVVLDSELISTDLNANYTNDVDFNWTPVAGTYTINCNVDYNISDANLTNNSYSENVTITSANAPSGGGGGGSSPKTEITKTLTLDTEDNTIGNANFSNSDNDGVDKVIVNNIEELSNKLSLTLNTDPELTASDFKVIIGQDVISYLQFTYSGDQTKLQNANIVFSLPKTKVSDASIIRLGRLNNNVWTYYVPTIEDKGTYYQFTVEVPGFSYFAIVSFKEITKTDNSDTNTNVNTNTTNNNSNTNTNVNNNTNNNYNTNDVNVSVTNTNNDDNNLVQTSKVKNYTTYYVLGIVIIIVLLFGLYKFLRPKEPKQLDQKQYSFNANDNMTSIKQDIL